MEMMAMVRAFADAAGPAAVSALWQGAALALGLALCLRLTPRIAATDRFRAWAAGFAALVALPFLPVLLSFARSLVAANTPAAAEPFAVVAAPHAWLNHAIDLDPRWSLAIAGVWLAASLARAVDLGVHTLRLRRLWKRAVPIQTSEAQALAGSRAQVCTTRDLDRPSVIGFFAPRILIPDWLLERLTAAELEQVVLHEAEHLRRRDDWINLLQKLCLVAFPLNPALAWMERRLCREREIACDEGVVRRTQAPRAYAACLASLAERRLERRRGLGHRAEALSLGAWQRRPELVDRVHRILRRGPGLHPAAARALLGVVGCGLVFGSVELARCPQVVDFTAQPVATNQADVNADAMIDGRSMRGFRAIDAVAHVPTRAELAAARMVQPRSSVQVHRARWSANFARHPQKADPSTTPSLHSGSARHDSEDGAQSIVAKSDVVRRADSETEIAVKDTAPSSTTAQPQQWIVYTEWEQVESTTQSPTAKNASETPRVARRYSVTQLILRVYPAGAMQAGTANAGVAKASANRQAATRSGEIRSGEIRPGTTSIPFPIAPLPAAIPTRDGWLVLQL